MTSLVIIMLCALCLLLCALDEQDHRVAAVVVCGLLLLVALGAWHIGRREAAQEKAPAESRPVELPK